MTLHEFIRLQENDFDTYDTEYDACVTVCYSDVEEHEMDDYEWFCNEIVKKVNVVKVNNLSLSVNWSELIQRNMEKFKEFTNKYWKYTYEDDIDEFIYQWINEINLYLAGYVSESFYKTLNKFVETLV